MSTKLSMLFKNNLTWKVLFHFLAYPSTELYVKELSRTLSVGPTSVNNALRQLARMRVLHKRERARCHFYSLNNEDPIVKHLKVAAFLARLRDAHATDKFLASDADLVSLCIYGSYADGTFDERSDLDIFILSQKPKPVFTRSSTELERMLKLDVNVEVISLSSWSALREQDAGFYHEVVASHILLYGSELP